MDSAPYGELAALVCVSSSDWIPVHDIRLWGHGKLRHAAWGESCPRQRDRAADLWSRHKDGATMVQPVRVHYTGRIHLWQCGTQLNLWPRVADSRRCAVAHL